MEVSPKREATWAEALAPVRAFAKASLEAAARPNGGPIRVYVHSAFAILVAAVELMGVSANVVVVAAGLAIPWNPVFASGDVEGSVVGPEAVRFANLVKFGGQVAFAPLASPAAAVAEEVEVFPWASPAVAEVAVICPAGFANLVAVAVTYQEGFAILVAGAVFYPEEFAIRADAVVAAVAPREFANPVAEAAARVGPLEAASVERAGRIVFRVRLATRASVFAILVVWGVAIHWVRAAVVCLWVGVSASAEIALAILAQAVATREEMTATRDRAKSAAVSASRPTAGQCPVAARAFPRRLAAAQFAPGAEPRESAPAAAVAVAAATAPLAGAAAPTSLRSAASAVSASPRGTTCVSRGGAP